MTDIVGRAVLKVIAELDQRSTQGIGQKFAATGKQMTAGLTVPLLGVAAASVKTAASFETSLNILQAATGATSDEMAQMEEQAKQLGAETVFSANEAAEAMVELGKAGFSTKETMAAVPEVMNLAATEGLRLADAAQSVTSALSQFGLQAKDSGQVVNALAGASNASSASVAGLSQSLSLVGSSASSIGLNVQETAGALAALADNGLKGSIAGTSLSAVFNHLVPQTEKASTAMGDLGLDFTKANGEFLSMSGIAEELQQGFKGMDAESRKLAIAKIFGNDASTLAAVNGLIAEGEEGLKKYTVAAKDQDAAQRLADARMKGTAGSLEALMGSLETAGLAIGQVLLPFIQQAADFLAELANRFTALPESTQALVVAFGAVAAAIGPVLVVIGSVLSALSTIGAVLGAVSLAPVLAIGVAIGGLVAVFALLIKNSASFRATLVNAFESIKAAVLPAIDEIVGLVQDKLIPGFLDIEPKLRPVVEFFATGFIKGVVQMVKGVTKVIVGLVKVITGVVDVIAGILTGDWARVWDGAKAIFSGFVESVVGLFQTLIGALLANFPVLQNLVSILKSVFSAVASVASTVAGALVAAFKAGATAVGAIVGVISKVIAAIRPFVNIWLKGLGIQFRILRGIAKVVFAVIGTAITVAFRIARRAIQPVITMIRVLLIPVIKLLGSVAKTVFNAYRSLVVAVFQRVIGAGRPVVTFFRNGLIAVFNAVRDVATKVFPKIREIAEKAFNGIKTAAQKVRDVLRNAWNGIGDGLESAFDGVLSVARSVADKINGLIGAFNKLPGPDISKIPSFATGTLSAPGGLALVGELGPELIELPSGSRVRPAGQTRSIAQAVARQAVPAGDVTINQNFFGPTTGRERMRELEWTLRYATRAKEAF